MHKDIAETGNIPPGNLRMPGKKDLKKSPCEILFALATFAPWREGKTQNLPHHNRKFRSGQKNSEE
jgi:hypothetical protein